MSERLLLQQTTSADLIVRQEAAAAGLTPSPTRPDRCSDLPQDQHSVRTQPAYGLSLRPATVPLPALRLPSSHLTHSPPVVHTYTRIHVSRRTAVRWTATTRPVNVSPSQRRGDKWQSVASALRPVQVKNRWSRRTVTQVSALFSSVHLPDHLLSLTGRCPLFATALCLLPLDDWADETHRLGRCLTRPERRCQQQRPNSRAPVL